MIISLFTLFNQSSGNFLTGIYNDREKVIRSRNRRQADGSLPEAGKDYTMAFNDAQIWHHAGNGVRMISSFRADEKKIIQRCELLSLPIQFYEQIKHSNGSSTYKAIFGYLNLLSEGPKSDEIFVEPNYNDNECMVIKKYLKFLFNNNLFLSFNWLLLKVLFQ